MALLLRNLILRLACGVSLSGALHAQVEALPPGSLINVRFTAYAVNPPGEPLAFAPRATHAAQLITCYSSARSATHTYKGPNPIEFFAETPPAVPGQPPERRVLARATVPPGITQPLFIFFANPETARDSRAPRYVVYVLDDTADALPGYAALLNVSGLEFVGRFNRELIPVRAGLNAPVPVGRSAHIDLRTRFQTRYIPSYNHTHPLAASERALILLLPPHHPGSLEVQVRILKNSPAESPTTVATLEAR
jgi:hypothetical protein